MSFEEASSGGKKKRRIGVKRWIVLAMIALGIYCAYLGPSYLKPVSPAVVLPAEPIWPGVWITNTMLATIVADIILILLAIGAFRFVRSGKKVPSGIYNIFEAIVEFLYNAVEGATGKWVKRVIPLVATIFLLIFTANMVKLFPGFETIGWLEEAHKGTAYGTKQLFSIGSFTVYTLDAGQKISAQEVQAMHADESSHEADDSEESHTEVCEACHVIPFLRGSATDLNFTFALAVIAVVMTQVFGVWSLGPGYFLKFFPFNKLSKGAFGAIDFVVGLLELILEFAKILSFSFRLFGNIFAGALLLAIIGALLPVIIPPGLYIFEIFFGAIQAYVFFLLATMFISMALVSHQGEEHH